MNALITNLNSWGERFLNLAGPMLWQSSLLILVLFTLDVALRRKVRPSVRYALWLVLLVKLLLPPTLALPSSVAWWIRPSPSPQPLARQFVVTYPNGEVGQPSLKLYEAFTGGALQSPRAKLSPRGWLLVGSGLVSVGLLTWMLRRWWQVARMVRRAAPATEALANLVNETRQTLGLRRTVSLRFTAQPMSPAVCGLFRPVIILPQTLAEQLPPNQLRAVLLHELAHLKRGDVWVNCAQALLQVVYWWHPLLWPANVRIRRLREEAVDDAVMLALRDDAPTYAPALLEVAKLAFHRPTAALGLVGIMESRSALRQRIERLVNSDTPRKSGLTILSVVGVLAFSALAVPMEQAPVPSVKPLLDASSEAKPASGNPTVAETNVAALMQIVRLVGRQEIVKKLHHIRLAHVFYDEVPLDDVIRSLREEAKKGDPDGQGVSFTLARDYVTAPELQWPQIKIRLALTNITLGDVLDAIVKVADKPIRYSIEDFGVMFSSGKASEPLVMREFKLDPQSFGQWLQYAAAMAPAEVNGRLPSDDPGLILPRVNPREMESPALSPTVQADLPGRPERGGVVSLQRTNDMEQIHQALRSLFSASGVDLSPPKFVFYGDRKGILVVKATQADLEAIQRLVEKWNSTSPPTVASAVTPSSASPSPPTPATDRNEQPAKAAEQLANRRFKVDPNTFSQALGSITPLPVTPTNASVVAGDFFARLGVELNPPKIIFFNDRAGELLVRATLQDLDTIETALQVINKAAQQVNIKAMMVELSPREARALQAEFWPDSGTNQLGILTKAKFRAVRQALQKRAGSDVVSLPEVTTESGRQAQVQSVELRTVVNGMSNSVTNGVTNTAYQTATIPFGPVLDVIPYVAADGVSIQLTLIPTITEFLGYDDPKDFTDKLPPGERLNGQLPLPRMRVRQITTSAVVLDGQTIVLANFSDVIATRRPDGSETKEPNPAQNAKQLIVFITPTIVDPAGNRVHPAR